MSTRKGPSGTPAIDALRRAGVPYAIREYEATERTARERDSRPNYGFDAARALGIAPDRLHKTLVAVVDGDRLAVAVLPVSRELDLKRFAAALGGRRSDLADATQAERATGYVVGGISPLGQRRHLPLVVDRRALDHETIFVSAGRRGLQLELAGSDLVRVTGAVVTSITRDGAPSLRKTKATIDKVKCNVR